MTINSGLLNATKNFIERIITIYIYCISFAIIKDNTKEKINRNHGNYNNFQIFRLVSPLFNY